MFHSTPGARQMHSTRATSAAARSASNQCHAWATSTASTCESGSGICSAEPSRAEIVRRGHRGACQASRRWDHRDTRRPRSTSRVVSLPVPAPRSRTSRASQSPVGASSASRRPPVDRRVGPVHRRRPPIRRTASVRAADRSWASVGGQSQRLADQLAHGIDLQQETVTVVRSTTFRLVHPGSSSASSD